VHRDGDNATAARQAWGETVPAEAADARRDRPLVSIGLPVYNGERFLRETLEALLTQEFNDYELLISDNASTDGTEAIAREFAERYPRISYQRNAENLGAARNFELLVERARGTYFIWASAHDLLAPTFLSKCVEIMDSRPSVILCYCHTRFIDAEGKAFMLQRAPDTRGLGRHARYKAALWHLPCYAIYGLHRTATLRQAMPILGTLGMDFIMLTELALLGEFALIPEPLFGLRLLVEKSGDWRGYFHRLSVTLTWWNPPLLAWRYVALHLSRVCRHSTGPGDEVYLVAAGLVRSVYMAAGFLVGLAGSTLFPGLYRRLARCHYGVRQR